MRRVRLPTIDKAEQLVRLPTFLNGRAYNLYRRLQAEEGDNMVNFRTNLIYLFYAFEARETRRLELTKFKCLLDEETDQFVYRLERKFIQIHPDMQTDA